MSNIDILEAAAGGPLAFTHEGERFVLPHPSDLPFQIVLACLEAECPPRAPALPSWKAACVFGRWQAHHDLPDYNGGQRLAYLVDHYRSALVYDIAHFCPGSDLGDLWRRRRWRTLLDLIDHLPSHSWYSAAVSGDEEHAKLIAESMATRESEGERIPSGPPLQTWTPEVAAITQVTDAVRQLTYVTAAVAGDKSSKSPEPMPRPHSAIEKAMKDADRAQRTAAHNDLVAKFLPHKAGQER